MRGILLSGLMLVVGWTTKTGIGATMRFALLSGLLLMAACTTNTLPSTTVPGEYEWHKAHDVNEVAIYVSEVTESEMQTIRQKYPSHRDDAVGLLGMAVFGKDENGDWLCHIYALDEYDQRIMDHEIRHCHGWVHQ